jgi:hypothetical protein
MGVRMYRMRTVVAILMMCAIVVTDAAVSSAHEFVASKTGNVTVKAGEQEFKELPVFVTIKCKEASGKGTVTALKSEELKLVVQYEHCGTEVHTFEAVHYAFTASGEIKVEQNAFITSNLECEDAILKQAIKAGVPEYSNSGGKLNIRVSTGAMKTVDANGCGSTEIFESGYLGTLTVSLEGGSIEWK